MSNRIYDTNGWYSVEGNPIARSGILEYLGSQISEELEPDRIYKVWIPESELNNPETINSFKMIPWIPRHKMLGDRFGASAESVGVQGVTGENVYFDEETKELKSTLKAFGSNLISMVDGGVSHLSIGRTCDWNIQGGVNPDGEPYDVIQTNIRGNHLASVIEGRAGKGVAVMDAAEVVSFAMDALDFKPTNENEVSNMTIEEILAALKELKPSLDQMKEIQTAIAGLGGEPEAEITEETTTEEVAEDMGEEDKDKEKSPVAMDAAISSAIQKAVNAAVKPLQAQIKKLEGSAMDEASVIKAINAKNSLAYNVARHTGAFDHNAMSSEIEVAKYAVKKLNIACDSGEELAHVKGWLAAKTAPVVVKAIAEDGKNKPTSKTLEDEGM
jgi:uncharacterized protein